MAEDKKINHRPPKERRIDPDNLKEPFYSIYEVADLMKLHHKTIRRMINAGELPAKKYGGQWRIKRDDLRRFID